MGAVKGMLMDDAENILNVTADKLIGGDISEDDALDILDKNKVKYDQVLYVDADTIIHPNAPNIFEKTDHKFCAVRNFGCMDWVCRSLENYSKILFSE